VEIILLAVVFPEPAEPSKRVIGLVPEKSIIRNEISQERIRKRSPFEQVILLTSSSTRSLSACSGDASAINFIDFIFRDPSRMIASALPPFFSISIPSGVIFAISWSELFRLK